MARLLSLMLKSAWGDLMALFDEKHKAAMEENSRKLKARLEQTVKEGPKSNGLMDTLSFNFSRNLLHSMNTRKVVKK